MNIMDQPKKEIIEFGITGFLVIFLLFLSVNAAYRISKAKKPKRVEQMQSEKAQIAENAKVGQETLYAALEKESRSFELVRDPFTGIFIGSPKNATEVTLNGILWGKGEAFAIINGNIVKRGEQVGPKTVIEIRQDRVVLSDGSTLTELLLEH